MQDKILRTIANPTRLKIIKCLSKGEKNVSEMEGVCGLSQSAVSQHLAKLRESGLVECSKRGKEVYYKLMYPEAAEIGNKITNLIKRVKS